MECFKLKLTQVNANPFGWKAVIEYYHCVKSKYRVSKQITVCTLHECECLRPTAITFQLSRQLFHFVMTLLCLFFCIFLHIFSPPTVWQCIEAKDTAFTV